MFAPLFAVATAPSEPRQRASGRDAGATMALIIDETRDDIAQIISRDFGPVAEPDLNGAFLDWVHYRARRIPCRPRRVMVSRQAQNKSAAYPAINRIGSALSSGEDVSPWLSRKLSSHRRHHDVDMMFNAWQISHFHLGQVFATPHMIRGKKELLFAHVTAEQATLLDVLPHESWTAQGLLHILLETHPQAMERFELKGMSPELFSDNELHTFRAKGVNAAVTVGGRVFSPRRDDRGFTPRRSPLGVLRQIVVRN